MKKFFIAVFTLGLVAAPVSSAFASDVLLIMGTDKQFLGYGINSEYDFESICNQNGNHGSNYSPVSIYSQFASYGSQYSDLSAYNPNARKPPVLFRGATPVGFVTKNKRLPNAVDPDYLRYEVCR
jgi:hypothetical protein